MADSKLDREFLRSILTLAARPAVDHLMLVSDIPLSKDELRGRPIKKKIIYAVSEEQLAQTLRKQGYVCVTVPPYDYSRFEKIKVALVAAQSEGLVRDGDTVLALAGRERGMDTLVRLRIDMEDRETTDYTLRIYRELLARHGSVTTVLQARMRRTLKDIDSFPAAGASVRLCKGIYLEPRSVAWTEYHTIRRAYVAALDKLLSRGIFTGIATHDEYLVQEAFALLDRYQVPRDRYEFQMLLGVNPELRKLITGLGHRLRVYVPFGTEWYAYSTRRLRENPDIARHVVRAFFGLR